MIIEIFRLIVLKFEQHDRIFIGKNKCIMEF